ncbi:hypothetical protein AMK28_35855 [Streptomyces sp. CB02115]|nr:hypothetical protein AMK28_35855 [Streptomyces sp. CB02115]
MVLSWVVRSGQRVLWSVWSAIRARALWWPAAKRLRPHAQMLVAVGVVPRGAVMVSQAMG